MIALLEAYRGGVLKTKYWLPNSIAGLVVGVVAFPLAIAFAIVSGLKPEQGLYTAIFAGLVVSIFGGSRVQIAGPDPPGLFRCNSCFREAISPAVFTNKSYCISSKYVPFIDATGLKSFSELLESYRKLNITIYLCEANPHIVRKLVKTNILSFTQEHRVYPSIIEVLRSCTLTQHSSESSNFPYSRDLNPLIS